MKLNKLVLGLCMMFILVITIIGASASELELNESKNDTIIIEDEVILNESKLINYTDPTERILRFPIKTNNPLDSKSYIITLTGNEINYDVEVHTLTNGKVLFKIMSPILSDYETIEEDDIGKIIKEKQLVYEQRKDELKYHVADQHIWEEVKQLLESKDLNNEELKYINDQLEILDRNQKYDEIHTVPKEILMYDALKLRTDNVVDYVNKTESTERIIYQFIVDPNEITNFKFGEATGTVNLTRDIIAYWKLDETSGTVAEDSVAGTYNGTIEGATINQVGKINKSYDFDGSNDYLIHQKTDSYDDFIQAALGGTWVGGFEETVTASLDTGGVLTLDSGTWADYPNFHEGDYIYFTASTNTDVLGYIHDITSDDMTIYDIEDYEEVK